MKVTELLEAKEPAQFSIDELAKAIADGINHNGTRIFGVEVDPEEIFFSIEFDFPEGFIKGSEIKKVSKAIQKVSVSKSQNWRHGETGADYTIELKTPLSDADAKKLKSALKKLTTK